MIPSPVEKAFTVTGGVVAGYFALKTVSALYYHLHTSQVRRYNRGPDVWALVTGASDGIGKAFVYELAQQGFNVILHGRNKAKLEKLIDELQKQFKQINFKTLIIDASTAPGPEFDKTVLSCIDGLKLTVVIHNVGGPGDDLGIMRMFDEYSMDSIDRWMNVNARFPTQLTRVVLPTLVKNQPALMMYVSSGAAEITTPYVAVYGGGKAYIERFAQCVGIEAQLNGQDIEIKALTVGMVATASSGRSEKDIAFTMPSPQSLARSALNKVGLGAVKVIPWIGHWVQFQFLGLLPEFLKNKMMLSLALKAKASMDKVT